MKYIVTGSAGFIGYHLSKRLLEEGHQVIGVDNLNNYYDVQLKLNRNSELSTYKFYEFYKADIADYHSIQQIFINNASCDTVFHLAAQAGVRYSIENPQVYVNSNLVGFANILECCRNTKIRHLVYASSSSIYGANAQIPFLETDKSDEPVSFYGATKKANELMAYSYSHLYGIPCSGLRFFTVYGPWGRPDMAYFSFVKSILENKPIKIYNHGNMQRDFTYIDDIIEGIIRVSRCIPQESSSGTKFAVYNIGNNNPVELGQFIFEIEKALGKEAKKEYISMQPGDMKNTYADVHFLINKTGYRPNTLLADGIKKFLDWDCLYYF
jgi:UDP-glucuronate 4-epimerase